MGFRVIVVKSRAKLQLQMNYLVCRAEEEKRVHLSEINTVVIQSTAVALTAALLCELVKRNIKVIFCDEKSNPSSELLPYYGGYRTSKMVDMQTKWTDRIKAEVWKSIVEQKIGNQARLLAKRGFFEQAKMLEGYVAQVETNDQTNREGHAAKVYFNVIFGDGFSRQSDCFINGCLNYGYAILLSAFNREVVAAGHITQIGIWHGNTFNPFNLSSDIMEPFRQIVDEVVLSLDENDRTFKTKLIDILNKQVTIENKNTTLENAVRIYTRSVLESLNNEVNAIKFLDGYEL
jgi:CRISPR-associated endonuclease Cas1 subtype II